MRIVEGAEGHQTVLDAADQIMDARMLGDGMPFADILWAREQVASGNDWLSFWPERGDDYEQRARLAEAEENPITAGRFNWLGSMCYHYALFPFFSAPGVLPDERRRVLEDRKIALYHRAMPHLRPAAQALHISYEETRIPGYLRTPAGEPPSAGWPCVLLLGAGESTKEESVDFENRCLERGMATFAFDGPGQGEYYWQVKLSPNFEKWTSAVIDFLSQSNPAPLDTSRLGILGRSTGGHYALRSAASDHRIKAAVGWEAFGI